MALDQYGNFAQGTIASVTSNTVFTLQTGQGAYFSAPSWAVVLQPGTTVPTKTNNAEVVRITDVTGDQLTVLRAQDGTSGVAGPYSVGMTIFSAAVSATYRGLQNSAPPIGAIMPYAGYGDPSAPGIGADGTALPGTWVIADGRLIDSTQYPDFDALCGAAAAAPMTHAYNGGVNPGNNGSGHQQVKIPDKRGRASMGAINMGSSAGAGANDNAHYQGSGGARSGKVGDSSGEVLHTLAVGEMPAHSHTGTGGASSTITSSTQKANISVSTSMSADNAVTSGWYVPNSSSNAITWTYYPTSGGNQWGVRSGNSSWAATSLSHSHTATSTVTDGLSNAGHYHTTTIPSQGSGTGHNTVSPFEADSYLVRIA